MRHQEEFRAYMKAANGTSGSNDDRHLTEAQVIAFCRGEISAPERDYAETHLVSCERCLAAFRSARDFLEPAGNDEEEITAAETDAAWNSLWTEVQPNASTNVQRDATTTVVSADFQRSRDKTLLSLATLPLAACLLLSLGVLGWQTWRLFTERRSRQQSQEIAAQLENRQRELEQRLKQLEQTGGNQLQQEREQRLAAEAERDQLQDRLSQLGHEEVPVYTARLSSERGAEDDVRVRFSSVNKAARLKLLISKPYEFPEYVVELADESGRVVMKASGLRPRGDDGALALRINRTAFSAGKYKLRLFGGKEKKPLGEYGVSVTVTR
jgi:hypothetical protein